MPLFDLNQYRLETAIRLDTKEVPQALLNIENRERKNLLGWNGQFSPQFVETMLNYFSKPDDKVLDPFVGSGTVLAESINRKQGCIGTEINPSAYILSSTYTLATKSFNERKTLINEIDTMLNRNIPLMVDEKTNLEEILLEFNNIYTNEYKTLINTLIVLLNFGEKKLESKKLYKTWEKLKEIILQLPYTEKEVSVLNNDARKLPLPEDHIDFVLTSPPYINVFNYHQQYRKSTEALGWDVLSVAKSEIGANRKHRSNRFLTVIQYCLEIVQVLSELKRVCKKDSRIIFVVGRESNVRGTKFLNGELVYQLGVLSCGLALVTRQERVFQNRYGAFIHEDILHFQNTKSTVNDLANARYIAQNALQNALAYAPSTEALEEIKQALLNIDNVKLSPILKEV